MDIVFVDTNVILDWLSKREPFFIFSKQLFLKGENKEIKILVSTMSLISTEYILRKQIGKEKAKQALAAIRTITEVCTRARKKSTYH